MPAQYQCLDVAHVFLHDDAHSAISAILSRILQVIAM